MTVPTRPGATPTRRDQAVDLGVCLLVALATLPDQVRTAWTLPGAGARGLLVLAGLLPVAALAVRRRWPAASLVVASVGMLLALLLPDVHGAAAVRFGMALPPVLLPASMAWFGVLYSVAAHGRGRWPQAGLVAGLAGGTWALARLWHPQFLVAQRPGLLAWRLALGLGILAGVLGAWAWGRMQAERREDRAAEVRRREVEQARRVHDAVAEERRRIARELHDVVSHSLAVMVRQAEGGRMVAAKDPARAAQALDQIAHSGRAAMSDMRSLLGLLRETDDLASRPPAGDELGVDGVVERLRQAGMAVSSTVTGAPGPLSAQAALAGQRVVQESLTNVTRHAGAGAPVAVEQHWEPGRLRLVVRNEPDPAADGGAATRLGSGSGSGLAGLRERVEQIGGRLTAGPQDGCFVVEARIPTQGTEE